MDPKTLVLIVDDDADDVEFFREALLEIYPQAKFYSASGAEEGLRLLQNTSTVPDYIFLDLNMPRMDGKTFLSTIKSDKKYNTIPVIIYTTSSNSDEIKTTRELGADYFLTKPTSFVSLCGEIKKVLSVISKNNHGK